MFFSLGLPTYDNVYVSTWDDSQNQLTASQIKTNPSQKVRLSHIFRNPRDLRNSILTSAEILDAKRKESESESEIEEIRTPVIQSKMHN